MADIRLVRRSSDPSDFAFAVTPLGHITLNTQSSINNYAFQWGLPFASGTPGVGNATVTVVGDINWIGPEYIQWLENIHDRCGEILGHVSQ